MVDRCGRLTQPRLTFNFLVTLGISIGDVEVVEAVRLVGLLGAVVYVIRRNWVLTSEK